MGKKNNNYYEDTPEAKLQRLSELDEIIYGKSTGSILDLGKVKDKDVIMENGLSKAVNNAIIARAGGAAFDELSDIDDEDDEIETSKIAYDTSETCFYDKSENTTVTQEPVKEEESFDAKYPIRKITFKYFNDLKRLIIDDGIAPTSVSYEYAIADKEWYTSPTAHTFIDADKVADTFVLLLRYIISMQHPTAMFRIDKFEDNCVFRLKNKSDYDINRYFFLQLEDLILCYYIDDSIEDFKNSLDGFTNDEMMQILFAVAAACSRVDNACFVEEGLYMSTLLDSKTWNNDFNFEENFIKDNEDKLPDDDFDSFPMVDIIDIVELQTAAREVLAEFSMFYCDEDDELDDLLDDDDEEEDQIDEDDTEEDQLDEDDTEDVADDLLSDEMEEVDNDSLVIDVHRKTDKRG